MQMCGGSFFSASLKGRSEGSKLISRGSLKTIQANDGGRVVPTQLTAHVQTRNDTCWNVLIISICEKTNNKNTTTMIHIYILMNTHRTLHFIPRGWVIPCVRVSPWRLPYLLSQTRTHTCNVSLYSESNYSNLISPLIVLCSFLRQPCRLLDANLS